jgi:hypothetical protein
MGLDLPPALTGTGHQLRLLIEQTSRPPSLPIVGLKMQRQSFNMRTALGVVGVSEFRPRSKEREDYRKVAVRVASVVIDPQSARLKERMQTGK